MTGTVNIFAALRRGFHLYRRKGDADILSEASLANSPRLSFFLFDKLVVKTLRFKGILGHFGELGLCRRMIDKC
jgi:hypothetical protein